MIVLRYLYECCLCINKPEAVTKEFIATTIAVIKSKFLKGAGVEAAVTSEATESGFEVPLTRLK